MVMGIEMDRPGQAPVQHIMAAWLMLTLLALVALIFSAV